MEKKARKLSSILGFSFYLIINELVESNGFGQINDLISNNRCYKPIGTIRVRLQIVVYSAFDMQPVTLSNIILDALLRVLVVDDNPVPISTINWFLVFVQALVFVCGQ